jgi:integrase
MARRGAGEGSIFKRADGLWVGKVQVGVDENGKRLRRTVYGKTRAAVLEKVDELRQRVAAGPWVDAGTLRVGEYLDAWLRDVAGPRVRGKTLDYYRRVLRPVRSAVGGLQLRALTPMHVQALLARMDEAGASPRARQMTYTVLRTALRDAVRMRLLVVNPLDAVSRPRAPRPEIQALDPAQVKKLLKAAEGDPLEALYAMAVGTGLRLGELVGLRWGDLDLEASAVHVRRALVERESGAREIAEPKTSRARRKVDVPGFAIAALRRHREALGALPHPERPVFTSPDGEPMRRSNLYRRSWKPLLRRAKLPDVPFHALRHTSATMALAAGVNPKVVQERLGHSSVTLTLDTYSHAVPTLGKEAAARLDALVGG